MSDFPHGRISGELRTLLSALVEDTLTDQQQTALEQLVANDDAARAHYIEIVMLHAMLTNKCEPLAMPVQEAGEETTRNSPLTIHHSTRSTWGRFATQHKLGVSLAAGLVFVVALVGWAAFTYLPSLAGSSRPVDRQPVQEAVYIAKLLDWRGVNGQPVQWFDKTRPPLADPRLQRGTRLAFSAGMIEIKYNSGAVVVIEGPAEYVVGSAEREMMNGEGTGQSTHHSSLLASHSNSGFLLHGQLVARCETAESKGFSIDTPKMTVTDLGTEFAMHVDKQGEAKVHVLEGSVATVSYLPDGSRAERILHRNESVLVAADGATSGVAKTSEDISLFARRLPGSIQLPAQLEQTDYREVILADKPVAYWPLDDRTDQVLTDMVASRPTTAHGALASLDPADPRREPATLLFDGHTSYASTAHDTQLNTATFSIEAWSKPLTPQGGYRAVLSNREDRLELGVAGYVLYLAPNNRWEFWLGTSRGPKQGNDWQRLVGPEARIGRWTHLAATFEPNADQTTLPVSGTAKLYIDGRLVAAEQRHFRTNPKRAFFLGGVLESNTTPKYHFDGNLAHVAVYNRVLSDRELRRHFQAANDSSLAPVPLEKENR